MRLDIRKGEAIKQGDKQLGNRTKIKVVKNKVAPPFRTCEFDIVFGKGISKVGDILDLATDIDIVSKSGSWFSYGEERLGQGREKAKETLLSRPELMIEIETAVREHFGLKALEAPAPPAEEAAPDAKKPAKKSVKKAKDDDIVAKIDLDDAEIDSIIQELGLGKEDDEA